jgi:hypothetical protein
MYNLDLKSIILEVVALDRHYVQVKEGLQQGNVQVKFKNYGMKVDGILLYRRKVYATNSLDLIDLVVK